MELTPLPQTFSRGTCPTVLGCGPGPPGHSYLQVQDTMEALLCPLAWAPLLSLKLRSQGSAVSSLLHPPVLTTAFQLWAWATPSSDVLAPRLLPGFPAWAGHEPLAAKLPAFVVTRTL